MKLCIIKSDQEDFIQLMEMYDIQFGLVDEIEYEIGINDDITELIYIAAIFLVFNLPSNVNNKS